MGKTCAVIPAAGRGIRMGMDRPKQFLEVSEKPIVVHTLEVVSRLSFIDSIYLVVPKEFMPEAEALLGALGCGCDDAAPGGRIEDAEPCGLDTAGAPDAQILARPPITVVAGGAERQDSVFNGLRHLPAQCEWVLIHDGVRPFASMKLMEETWLAAHQTGAAIAALPATDTVKRVVGEQVVETVPREEMWLVQTPQVFRRELVMDAYLEARNHGWAGTDDAYFVERAGASIRVVRGERSNIKVTTREDLAWASWFLARSRNIEAGG